MEETEFQKRLRQGLGLRVGPEMAKFFCGKWAKDRWVSRPFPRWVAMHARGFRC